MGQEARGLIVVLALAALLQFIDLGGPVLWDRDEPRNAQCAREMLQRGDWVVPYFNAERRDHKPVLLYWLMMVSYNLLGVNEFAARAPSALLGTLTVATVYGMARRIWAKDTAFWAGLCFATCLLFTLVARAATPDATLIFCSTLSVAAFVICSQDFADTPSDSVASGRGRSPFPESWWQAAMIYAIMGLGVLAKGPVGLVMPTAVIGMYCLLRRLKRRDARNRRSTATQLIVDFGTTLIRAFHPVHFLRTCWSMRPITALAMVLAVAGPWYLWVGYRTKGAWLVGFFGTHNLGRAMEAMEGHQAGVWFYPLVLLAGTFPWSIYAVPAILRGWRCWRSSCNGHSAEVVQTRRQCDRRDQRGVLLASCWVGVYVVVFTLAATKLPNYVAPAYPAMALLFGSTVAHRVQGRGSFSDLWIDIGLGVKFVVGLAMVIGLYVALNQVAPELIALSLMGIIPIVFAMACWLVWRAERFDFAAAFMAASAASLTGGLLIVAAGQASTLNQYDEFFCTDATSCIESTRMPIACVGDAEPSWVFYAGRQIQEFHDDNLDGLTAFITKHQHAMVLTRSARRAETLAHLQNEADHMVTPAGDFPCFLQNEQVYAFTATHISLAQQPKHVRKSH